MNQIALANALAAFQQVLNLEKRLERKREDPTRYLRHLSDDELAQYAVKTAKMMQEG